MKRKELLERLAPKLAGYTAVHTDADYPFGWDLTKAHTPGEVRPAAPARSRPYDIKADKRLTSMFKPVSSQPKKLRALLEGEAVAIVAGLGKYDINMPTDEQVNELLAILHVTAAEMNDYTNTMPDAFLSCMGAVAIRPVTLILHRALLDAMCEGCGIAGWSWEEHQAEKAELLAEYGAEDEKPKAKGKAQRKKKSQYVPNGGTGAHSRLNAVADYLREHELLTLECLKVYESDPDEPESAGGFTVPGETVQSKEAEAAATYADFFCRYAELSCKRTIAVCEIRDVHECVERENDRVFAVGAKLLDQAVRRERRRSPSTEKKAAAVRFPLAGTADRQSSAPVFPSVEEISGGIRSKGISQNDIADAVMELVARGKAEEAEKLLDSQPSIMQLPESIKRLEARVEANFNALKAYDKAVLDAGLAAIDRIAELEAEYIKGEYGEDIAECAFVSILQGDEVYKLSVGMEVLSTIGHLLSVPWFGASVPDLEDEDEWDDACFNGKLAQEILKGNETFVYEEKLDEDDAAEDGSVNVPLRLNAAISEFANVRFDTGLYIRRSVVKAFRNMGFSERKSREYAIIVAVLRTVYDEEELYLKNYFHEPAEPAAGSAPAADGTAEPNRLLQDMSAQRDAAVRAKKAAENESQQLRHELAELHRKQAELQRKLKQQEDEIQKRDELIDIYEKAAANAEKGDADVADEELFPFKTRLRVVLYGGFHSFHQEIEKLIPDIRIVPMAAHIDVTTFRNADIIFLQINNTSHSAYWNVCETARNMEIPFHHLNYASPKRCAVEMVKKIREIEKKKS